VVVKRDQSNLKKKIHKVKISMIEEQLSAQESVGGNPPEEQEPKREHFMWDTMTSAFMP
jgi:hypothetical protein